MKFSVMTLNIHGWTHPDQGSNCKHVANIINELKPDAVVLNEVRYNENRKLAKLCELVHFQSCAFADADFPGFGNVILSPHSMTTESFTLQRKGILLRSSFGASNRSALIAKITVNSSSSSSSSSPVYVVATHLDHISEDERLSQIGVLFDTLSNKRIPSHFLCGDLNSLRREDYSETHWNLICQNRRENGRAPPRCAVTNLLSKIGYIDALSAANPSSVPMTAHTHNPLWRIDYILRSPKSDFKVLSCNRIEQIVSDHFALFGTFEIDDKEKNEPSLPLPFVVPQSISEIKAVVLDTNVGNTFDESFSLGIAFRLFKNSLNLITTQSHISSKIIAKMAKSCNLHIKISLPQEKPMQQERSLLSSWCGSYSPESLGAIICQSQQVIELLQSIENSPFKPVTLIVTHSLNLLDSLLELKPTISDNVRLFISLRKDQPQNSMLLQKILSIHWNLCVLIPSEVLDTLILSLGDIDYIKCCSYYDETAKTISDHITTFFGETPNRVCIGIAFTVFLASISQGITAFPCQIIDHAQIQISNSGEMKITTNESSSLSIVMKINDPKSTVLSIINSLLGGTD